MQTFMVGEMNIKKIESIKEKIKKGLIRAEYPHFVGWRIYLKYRDKIYNKYFSDKKYNGEAEGYKIAKKYLDDLKQKIGYFDTSFKIFPQSNNTSGYCGISKTYSYSGSKNIKYPKFQVILKHNSGRFVKSFYIHKYKSEKDALISSAIYRTQKENELIKRENTDILK